MIFKYELGFVAFTWPNLCLLDLSLLFIVLVSRVFVSGICKSICLSFWVKRVSYVGLISREITEERRGVDKITCVRT